MNEILNWDIFGVNFNGYKQKAFEMLAYHLFCRKYHLEDGLRADFNHSYLESSPARLRDGTVVGFQAKFYETPCVNSNQKQDLLDALEGAASYENVTKVLFYLNRPLSHSTKKGKISTAWQEEIEKRASELEVEIEWIVPSNLEIILNDAEMKDIWEYFFTLHRNTLIAEKDGSGADSRKESNQRINSEELKKYYGSVRDDDLSWIEKDGISYRADYLPLCGISDAFVKKDGTSIVVDLLDLMLNPSKYFKKYNACSTNFIAIYGPSHSGLAFLCETAFQSFVQKKATSEFENMAYFHITDKDIEETVLYEKLKIGGKSVFSEDFRNGLLIIEGIGRLFDKRGFNESEVSTLKNIILTLNQNNPTLRVVVTVRVSIEYDPITQMTSGEDITYIQNRMINLDDEDMQRILLEELSGLSPFGEDDIEQIDKVMSKFYNSPEFKAILKYPKWFKAFKYSLRMFIRPSINRTYHTKYEIVYKILHDGLVGERSWEEVDGLCVEIAKGIFANENWRYLVVNNTGEYANIPLLAVDGLKVGFENTVVLDFYIAHYLFGLYKNVESSRPESIVTFLAALTEAELVDGEYNEDYRGTSIYADVSTNHELIRYFFKDQCEKDTRQLNKRRTKSVFSYLLEGRIAHDCSSVGMFHDGGEEDPATINDVKCVFIPGIIEIVIRNLFKLLGDYLDVDTESVIAFQDMISRYSFSRLKLPATIHAEGGLEHAKLQESVFTNLKIGRDNISENKSKVLHSDFRGSHLENFTISNSDTKFCDFSNTSIDSMETHDSEFDYCSFEEVSINNASFKKTKFYHTSFNGLSVNNDAFDKSSTIDGKLVEDLSTDDWEKMGITFIGDIC